jgi:DASS family divalent anion:Na+ symporter
LKRLAALAVALGIWFAPVPEALSTQAWHLFALFFTTILSVVIGAFPILTASILGIAAAVLTGTLSAAAAYSGFANPTIVLIVVAFLVAGAVVKSGLGQRLGYRAISLFGKSTLGLSYSIIAVDTLIAPAFPATPLDQVCSIRLPCRWRREQGSLQVVKIAPGWRGSSCSRGC